MYVEQEMYDEDGDIYIYIYIGINLDAQEWVSKGMHEF